MNNNIKKTISPLMKSKVTLYKFWAFFVPYSKSVEKTQGKTENLAR